ncbi:hypothetical protein I302_103790 [Kwoniella bestiolae CBS 10118]|uniref:Metaxin glutathione S-transferase domain-containing protein n=1 Tax=Kwoniella bestiolae CBS 10118 TaxID=1296100 RepID=A0A1B9G9J6_9TREE|nr:hypothetical protein I302_02494 [Kwoniella bestiolae CBS 10118]OCF27650.1 hypothetical protein I302_02494 [Kwoniella bestiolae CBS 10118]
MAAATARPPSTAQGSTIFTAPGWVKSFYSKFPLVVLEQDDEVDWKVRAREGEEHAVELWIHPPSPSSRHWTSSSPSSLRTQLLFLLRETSSRVPVSFKSWPNEKSAPGGTLPALHILNQDRLLATDEIRGWLESTYPLKGKGKELQGLPTQATYDRALALSHLILGNLLPAYLASLPSQTSTFHLLFPNAPPLSAGLTTPLPASLTGDSRDIDTDEVIKRGIAVLDAVEVILESASENEPWLFGARHPTSIDALVTSHLYVVYSLPPSSVLRDALISRHSLGGYVNRVLDYAEQRIPK